MAPVKEEYTVLWLCPQATAHDAAVLALDEQHGLPADLPDLLSDLTALLNLGRIAAQNIVIIGCLQTVDSTVAASVASQIKNAFPNLKYSLLITEGGGVPTKTDAGVIRLGDIVVSRPTSEHPGAVKYDLTKAKSGQFECTGAAIARPPTLLFTAAQEVAAKRVSSLHDPIRDNVKRIDASAKEPGRYRYPGAELDHLCQAGYRHSLHREPCERAGCDILNLVPLNLGITDDDNPSITVHSGTVALGELAIEDGVLRDELVKGQDDLLCFGPEMVTAWADFLPHLVVQGISSYSDSHREDRWRGYAVAAAVAFVKELSQLLPVSDVRIQRETEDSAESESDDSEAELDERQTGNRDEALRYLCVTDHSAQLVDYARRRHPGSCQWFLGSEQYREWVRSSPRILSCSGPPGAGKTVLAAAVVQDLKRRFPLSFNVGVFYLACNSHTRDDQPGRKNSDGDDDDSDGDYSDLLYSFLGQLFLSRSNLSEIEDVSETIEYVIKKYSRVFIVVDELDEYSSKSRTKFLSEIHKLQVKHLVNLLTTAACNLEEIIRQPEKASTLHISAKEDDVRSYIGRQMDQLPYFVQNRADLRKQIKNSIVKASDGSFLLAHLHLQSLFGAMDPKSLQDSLASLATGPDAYNKMYDISMQRIKRQLPEQAALAHRVLSFVTVARRPLTISELQHALAIQVGDTEINNDKLPHVNDIVRVCAGLVTVGAEEGTGIVQPIHQTARSYLKQTRKQWRPEAEKEISTVCVAYLSLREFESGPCASNSKLKRRLQSYPLYSYASLHWGYHARVALPEFKDAEKMDFLASRHLVESSCQIFGTANLHDLHGDFYEPDKFPRRMTGLHLAAQFGVVSLIRRLSEQFGIKARDSYGNTPLALAARHGHELVVSLLLGNPSVDVNCQDGEGNTPISLASGSSHVKVVELLLSHGADPESKNSMGATPLFVAARMGHKTMAELLIQKGADLNVVAWQLGDKYTPLSVAAEMGHDNMVRFLLDQKGIKPHASLGGQRKSMSPLMQAIYRNHRDVVRILLEKVGVNPAVDIIEGNEGPLHFALWKADDEIFRLLLARDEIDPNATVSWGGTTLMSAIKSGRDGAAKMLIEKTRLHLDANVPDKDGRTLISRAAWYDREEIVALLLGIKGANPNLKDCHGRTPLSLAMAPPVDWNGIRPGGKEGSHIGVVRQLLDSGLVDSDLGDTGERTPLSYAAEVGRLPLVELLLGCENAIDINKQDTGGRSPMFWAVEGGHEKVVKLLLEKGADPNLKTTSNWSSGEETALSRAASNGNLAIVQLLLSMDSVDHESKNYAGLTPLFLAATNGHVDVVEQLLAGGADPDSQDNSGQTPLFLAAMGGHEEVVKTLLIPPTENRQRRRLEPDIQNAKGRTALSAAAEGGYFGIVELLLAVGRANPDAKDKTGRTPLSWAATGAVGSPYDEKAVMKGKGSQQVVKRLLGLPTVKPNSEDVNGWTPLFWAIKNDQGSALVDLLLQHDGVNVNHQDRDGLTPLTLAMEEGNDVMVEQLRASCAKPSMVFKRWTHRNPRGEDWLVEHYARNRAGYERVAPKVWFERSEASSSDSDYPAYYTDHEGRNARSRKGVYIELVTQGHVSDADEEICQLCASIDLTTVFSRSPVDRGGEHVAALGEVVDESWELKPCAMCRLIAAVRPRLGGGIDDDGDGDDNSLKKPVGYELRAYSSTGTLLTRDAKGSERPFQSDWVDTVFLGVVCVYPPKAKRDAYSHSGATHNTRRGEGFISRVGCNDRLHLRSLTVYSISPDKVDFGRARGWIDSCAERHGPQCNPRAPRPIPHLRLVDCATREIVHPTTIPPFVALSYVWGPQPDVADTKDRVRVDQSETALVIEDAIRVTVKLGYSHLWVDRYCITKQDKTVRQAQLRSMNAVYENAEVTILACASDNPASGLPGLGSRTRSRQLRAQIKGHILTTIPEGPWSDINNSVWSTRGWTYQEGLLSRRRLIFTEREISYECRGMHCREAIELPIRIHELAAKSKVRLTSRFFPQKGATGSSNRKRRVFWGRLGEYTERRLTFEFDILDAFLGVMQVFTELKVAPEAYHLCGIPILPVDRGRPKDPKVIESSQTSFVRSLCWNLDKPGERRRGFPSWSWTGWKGIVSGCSGPNRQFSPDLPFDVTIISGEGDNGSRMTWAEFEALDSAGKALLPQCCALEITAIVFEASPMHNEGSLGWEALLYGGGDTANGTLSLCKDPSKDSDFDRKLIEDRWLAMALWTFPGEESPELLIPGATNFLLLEQVDDHWERVGYITTGGFDFGGWGERIRGFPQRTLLLR